MEWSLTKSKLDEQMSVAKSVSEEELQRNVLWQNLMIWLIGGEKILFGHLISV